MKKFSLLPHTADIRLHLEADSPDELFRAGLEGMSAILGEDFCTHPHPHDLRERIAFKSPDRTSLLIDFLSEVLTLTHTQRAIFCEAAIADLREDSLDITVFGSPVDRLAEDIKAVTYHEANVHERSDGRWETIVIFDI